MTPALAATRAALVAALGSLPEVAAWPVPPDATDVPALWVDQPSAFLSATAATMTTATWAVVIVSDVTTSADVTDLLDDLAGVVVERVLAARSTPTFRFRGWTRGEAEVEVGGRRYPAVTITFESDHLTACPPA